MRLPGLGELIIILVIVVLVFGANKLPLLGDGIGKAIKNFKRGLARDDDRPQDVERMAAEARPETRIEVRVREAEAVEHTS